MTFRYPTPSKILIAGTVYAGDSLKEWLAAQWVSAAVEKNPGSQLALIDSASPGCLPTHPSLKVIQLGNNIGHLQSTGQDGWGRALTAALDYACAGTWDWLAFWDADMLMTQEVAPVVAAMQGEGASAATCIAHPYRHWIEGIFYFDCQWLRGAGIQAAYDWRGVCKGIFPEERIRAALGPSLRLLPFHGMRDDSHLLTRKNLWTAFPQGIHYLTHCQDKDVYREIMRRYRIPEARVGSRLQETQGGEGR